MPDRLPTFKPPWVGQRKRPRAPDTNRPSASARGYCSAGWKAARREVLLRDGYQCQVCRRVVSGRSAHVDHIVPKSQGGSDLVSNLQALCRGCHSKKTAREQHSETRPEKWTLHPKWMPRACIPVTLVCGPPASGKSTYVEQHKGKCDLVVDLDVIAAEMAGTTLHAWGLKWLGAAVRKRNDMLANLRKEDAKRYERAWLIVTEPKAEDRQWWVDRLGVSRVVVIETDAAKCEARMMTDEERSSRCGSALTWWKTYTPRIGDEVVRKA